MNLTNKNGRRGSSDPRFRHNQKGGHIMLTIIRWFLLKQKEIKLKLAFYRQLEQGVEYLAKHKDELETLFASENAKSNDSGKER